MVDTGDTGDKGRSLPNFLIEKALNAKYLRTQIPPMKYLVLISAGLMLWMAGCASNPATVSDTQALLNAGFQARTPTEQQRPKLQSLTGNQLSVIQGKNLTLYVYPDVPNNRVLVGGPNQFQAYSAYRAAHNLPAVNPPVYRGPNFDWPSWSSGL